jgi:PhnB protein
VTWIVSNEPSRTILINDYLEKSAMELSAYLNFSGQCAAAFTFYERCLGGKIVTMMSYGDSPLAEKTPQEWHSKILHATLHVGDAVLMGADAPPGHFEQPQGFSVTIALDSPAEAERIFESLAENGTVRMPLQQTFWADRFGMLVDQFGIPWMINCGRGA